MSAQAVVIENPEKIWNPRFINIFVVNILIQFCTFTMGTLSATYANFLGATATVVGLVSSLFALTALIFKMISAPAIDSFKRKKVLLGSIFILFISFVGYAVSTTIPMLIVSRLVTGIGLAFAPICCIAMASAALPPDKMGTGIGYFSLGAAICQALAPTIGLNLAGTIGYSLTFAFLAAILLLTLIYTATLSIKFAPSGQFKIALGNVVAQEALIPTVILFLLNMVFCLLNAFLILFGEKQGVPASNMGYFFTVSAVTMIFTRPLIGKLTDTLATIKVIIPSMFFFAISFLLISFSTSLPMFLLAGFISAFGYAGSQPALLALGMKCVPLERRGAAGATCYIGLDLGTLAGPVLAGAIIEKFGYASMWQATILPIFAAMLFSIFFRNRLTGTCDDSPTVACPDSAKEYSQ